MSFKGAFLQLLSVKCLHELIQHSLLAKLSVHAKTTAKTARKQRLA